MMTYGTQNGTVYHGLVSVRAVILQEREVVLQGNEEGEWELPGGRLQRGETPEECAERSVAQDLRVLVRVGPLLDAWLFRDIVPGVDVFVVTYGCYPAPFDPRTLGSEDLEVGVFRMDEVDIIPLAEGYLRSIRTWARDPRSISRWA
jgi:ADP-ribose pyrophosphatase YjhB (NUDIX family)